MNWYELTAIAIAILALILCAWALMRESRKINPMRRDRERDRVRRQREKLSNELEPFEWVPPKMADRLLDPDQRLRDQWDHVQRSFVERAE